MSATGDRHREAGYTLIELLVVLAILAFVVVLVTPMFERLAGPRLDLQAEAVGQALRAARAGAIRDNREVLVAIDTGDGTVTEAGGRELARIAPGVEIGLVAAVTERLGETTGGVRFWPDGSSSGAALTLGHGGRRVTLGVDWFDGSINIQRADGF